MQDEIFQIPAEISKVVSMAHRSLRLVCDTQENLTDEQMAKAMGKIGKPGWFTFSVEPVKPEDLLNLPPLTFDRDEKTPSQRLRAVLYRLWEQGGKPTQTFEEWYRIKMEKIIEHLKQQLL